VRTAEGPRDYQLIGEALAPIPALSPENRARGPVRLTPAGVDGAGPVSGPPACPFRAAGEAPAGQPPRVRVTAGRKSVLLNAPLGAGLFGLPFATSTGAAAPR
jgi:hypothetical protein